MAKKRINRQITELNTQQRISNTKTRGYLKLQFNV